MHVLLILFLSSLLDLFNFLLCFVYVLIVLYLVIVYLWIRQITNTIQLITLKNAHRSPSVETSKSVRSDKFAIPVN